MHEIQNELVYVYFATTTVHGIAALYPDRGVKHEKAPITYAIYYGEYGATLVRSRDWWATMFDRIADCYRRTIENPQYDGTFSIRRIADVGEFAKHLEHLFQQIPAYEFLKHPKCAVCEKRVAKGKVCSKACRQKLYRIQKKHNEKIQMG